MDKLLSAETKDGEWADNLMIEAVSKVENVVINIVSDVGEMVSNQRVQGTRHLFGWNFSVRYIVLK